MDIKFFWLGVTFLILVWVGMAEFDLLFSWLWVRTGWVWPSFGWVWVSVGKCDFFLAWGGWVLVSLNFFLLGVGGCEWVWLSVGECGWVPSL